MRQKEKNKEGLPDLKSQKKEGVYIKRTCNFSNLCSGTVVLNHIKLTYSEVRYKQSDDIVKFSYSNH